MKEIGITTTLPIEVLFAAGYQPRDLNNIFITHPERNRFIHLAEEEGISRNTCTWVKGIYGAVRHLDIKTIATIIEGDCSNNKVLIDIFKMIGVSVIPFSFPYTRDKKAITTEIEKFMITFNTTRSAVDFAKDMLDRIRAKAHKIDYMTWKENLVSGEENHLALINTSDMNGDPLSFEKELDALIINYSHRKQFVEAVRLGFIGVPPIIDGIYQFIESKEGRVVFNEVQRQFSMPYITRDIIDQYLYYTYPYDVFYRLTDIQVETRRREIDGIIHYIQSFCHRSLEDIIFKRYIDIPILTLQCEMPGEIDARTKIRIEGFISMIKRKKIMHRRH